MPLGHERLNFHCALGELPCPKRLNSQRDHCYSTSPPLWSLPSWCAWSSRCRRGMSSFLQAASVAQKRHHGDATMRGVSVGFEEMVCANHQPGRETHHPSALQVLRHAAFTFSVLYGSQRGRSLWRKVLPWSWKGIIRALRWMSFCGGLSIGLDVPVSLYTPLHSSSPFSRKSGTFFSLVDFLCVAVC